MAFIVFEGLDGAGKSSLISKLANHLTSQSQPHVVTREPGGTTLGEEIRKLLLRTDGEAPVPRTELLLYEAIRAQHVENLIRPALKEKKWVLCDRFTASSVAFQSGGRDLNLRDIQWLNNFATQKLKVDLTVLLDLSTEESLKRMKRRENETGVQADRFEQEARTFHERVRKSYLKQAKSEKSKWLILDAQETPDDLFIKLLKALERKKWLK